jgi:sugar lactone lactonase YvrE
MREWRADTLVLDARAQLAECPLWSVSEQKLYWVDITGCAIHRLNPSDGSDESWPVHCEPGCIGLADSGGLVVALRDGFYRFFPDSARLNKVANAPFDGTEMRFNDGRCDAVGRFWAGAMYEPRNAEKAGMFCLERGSVRPGWGEAQGWGVKVSNGLAFGISGSTLFQSDTPNHVIYQFAFNVPEGTVRDRRVFARQAADRTARDYGGRPDGAAIDAEGCYWSAQFEGHRILRYSLQGEVIGVIHVPARRPTMIAFGGGDLRTMYITTAREGTSAADLVSEPFAGGIFACRVEVPGLAEPYYLD